MGRILARGISGMYSIARPRDPNTGNLVDHIELTIETPAVCLTLEQAQNLLEDITSLLEDET